MTTWQVTAGAHGRDYSELFLEFGAMFIGPGEYGPHDANRSIYQKLGQSAVRAFAEDVQLGDRVVLKQSNGYSLRVFGDRRGPVGI